jgi:hypothetical protein
VQAERDLDAETVRVPDHVVYRTFAKETVALNLQSGTYHGLNPTAGRMLEVLGRSETVGAAADTLAAEFGRPRDEIRADLHEFCRQLLDRGLILIDSE